jgi:dipeptidyl aminopeptidase/acylaminoacyl peptidase
MNRLVTIAGAPDRPTAILSIRIPGSASDALVEVLREASELELDARYLSQPRTIRFPSADGRIAHAYYYPPHNPDFTPPPGERPPLLVESHGGPTARTHASFDPQVQFWTSRGFAVVDVNYGGSSGYGRAYRNLLRGSWGIVDTEDCVAAARWLAQEGLADQNRMAIRGGSAGGYTTLCALAFHDVFRAGASYYGVADLEAIACDTHKFESRYCDSLVGPYPATREIYRARSPIHHTGRLSCPIIVFQGLLDPVVPPSQAEAMIAALQTKKIPYAYVTYPDERHGFRNSVNVRHSSLAELSFYAQVFGFEPADELDPVPLVRP